MQVTFWGTRGSIASPGPDTLQFGGNTSCVELRLADEVLIFDCGTGIRALGNRLLEEGQAQLKLNLFISHVHWDHIQGFPFFAPLFVEGSELFVFGPQEQHQRLSDTMAGQMQYRYFPVDIDQLAAKIGYQELGEERVKVGPATVTTHYLNHTTLAMGYRVEFGSRSVVYATDTESFAQQPRAWSDPKRRRFFHRRDEELADFFAGADVLILDSQYNAEEYAAKVGWGHGTFDYSVDLAISAGVKHLVLFHHDPNRSDADLRRQVERSQARARAEGSQLEITAAAEHEQLDLPDELSTEAVSGVHLLPNFVHQVHVGLVGVDSSVEELSRRALQLTHFKLGSFDSASAFSNGEWGEFRPHLLLLQYRERGDVARAVEALERNGHRRQVPILALVMAGSTNFMQRAFDEGATDVMVQPFSPSQLRSRVDTWLFRGGTALDRRRHPRQGEPAASEPTE
ncbi:MAG: MBL fold metallo-hydrolase [Chloroflexota bacterium]|nr:MBL fold metallo-hydrolase [Chloroflexota bacterium]